MGLGDSIGSLGKGIFNTASDQGEVEERAKSFAEDPNYQKADWQFGGEQGLQDYRRNTRAEVANAETRFANLANYQNADQARNLNLGARQGQANVANLLMGQATGAVPSVAQQQATLQMQQAQAAQATQAASARGAAGMALAQQGAANNMANAQANISSQAQVNAANERLQATQAAAGAYNAMRAGDAGMQAQDATQSQFQAQMEQRNRDTNDAKGMQLRANELEAMKADQQGTIARQQMLAQQFSDAQRQNLAIAAANAKNDKENTDSIWDGIGGIAGAAIGAAGGPAGMAASGAMGAAKGAAKGDFVRGSIPGREAGDAVAGASIDDKLAQIAAYDAAHKNDPAVGFERLAAYRKNKEVLNNVGGGSAPKAPEEPEGMAPGSADAKELAYDKPSQVPKSTWFQRFAAGGQEPSVSPGGGSSFWQRFASYAQEKGSANPNKNASYKYNPTTHTWEGSDGSKIPARERGGKVKEGDLPPDPISTKPPPPKPIKKDVTPIGEDGPEVVKFPKDGVVIPNKHAKGVDPQNREQLLKAYFDWLRERNQNAVEGRESGGGVQKKSDVIELTDEDIASPPPVGTPTYRPIKEMDINGRPHIRHGAVVLPEDARWSEVARNYIDHGDAYHKPPPRRTMDMFVRDGRVLMRGGVPVEAPPPPPPQDEDIVDSEPSEADRKWFEEFQKSQGKKQAPPKAPAKKGAPPAKKKKDEDEGEVVDAEPSEEDKKWFAAEQARQALESRKGGIAPDSPFAKGARVSGLSHPEDPPPQYVPAPKPRYVLTASGRRQNEISQGIVGGIRGNSRDEEAMFEEERRNRVADNPEQARKDAAAAAWMRRMSEAAEYDAERSALSKTGRTLGEYIYGVKRVPGREDGGGVSRDWGVVPLMDSPDGRELHQGADGRAFYAETRGPSSTGASVASTAAPPTPAKPKAKPVQAAPAQRKMTNDELKAWADREEAKMRAEWEARLAEGPAVKPPPSEGDNGYMIGEKGKELYISNDALADMGAIPDEALPLSSRRRRVR